MKKNSDISRLSITGNSASLAKIGERSFTILYAEESNYAQGEVVNPGVKITTKEMFDVDGRQMNKFYTARVAIVNRFKNETLRGDINNNHIPLGYVKCISEKSASGKNFYNLVEA